MVWARWLRVIAKRLGRPSSTVSREVDRNGHTSYRARPVHQRACRPRPSNLDRRPTLEQEVKRQLEQRRSTEQIMIRLREGSPAYEDMQILRETIYLKLCLQGRKAQWAELSDSVANAERPAKVEY